MLLPMKIWMEVWLLNAMFIKVKSGTGLLNDFPKVELVKSSNHGVAANDLFSFTWGDGALAVSKLDFEVLIENESDTLEAALLLISAKAENLACVSTFPKGSNLAKSLPNGSDPNSLILLDEFPLGPQGDNFFSGLVPNAAAEDFGVFLSDEN